MRSEGQQQEGKTDPEEGADSRAPPRTCGAGVFPVGEERGTRGPRPNTKSSCGQELRKMGSSSGRQALVPGTPRVNFQTYWPGSAQ